MSWFKSTPESEALLAEERLVLAATEAVHDAMAEKKINGQQLAELLNVRPSEISQRLSGKRNLTLRSLARMLHVLGKEADLTLKDGHIPAYATESQRGKEGVTPCLNLWSQPLATMNFEVDTHFTDGVLQHVVLPFKRRAETEHELYQLCFSVVSESEESDDNRPAINCS